MKRMFLFTMLSAILAFWNLSVWAGEIEEMKMEIQKLREEYEAKIQNLQNQIDVFSMKPKDEVEKPETKEDTKGLDVEYVGRYEGPFERGGLVVNPFGFGDVSVGGYADIEFANFQNTHSAFDQRRWIINIGAELADRLRFYSEYEIEHGGTNASGGGEAKVEQAWIDYLINEAVNLRGGALLVPFGRYNLYHDSDLQELTDRPIVDRRVIPTTWTEAGAGAYGVFNPTIGSYEDLELNYEFYVINGLNANFSDTGLRGARGSLSSDNNNNKALVGRVVVSPFMGHEIGLSGYSGRYDNLNDYLTGGAIDWLTTWGPLEFEGEYAYFGADEPAGRNVAKFFKGYYLQLNYHFWPSLLNNTFLGRSFKNPKFTLVGRYDWVNIDDDQDVDALDNEERRFTLGFNYRPIESWVLKFEYQWNQTENEALEHGSNSGFLISAAMGF